MMGTSGDVTSVPKAQGQLTMYHCWLLLAPQLQPHCWMVAPSAVLLPDRSRHLLVALLWIERRNRCVGHRERLPGFPDPRLELVVC